MKEYIDKFALLEKAKTMQYGSIPFSMLYNEPIADVTPVVHADWIKDWEIGCSDCSHCGKGYLWEDYKGVADWKYCPNCGAKIDNRREDEEIH